MCDSVTIYGWLLLSKIFVDLSLSVDEISLRVELHMLFRGKKDPQYCGGTNIEQHTLEKGMNEPVTVLILKT